MCVSVERGGGWWCTFDNYATAKPSLLAIGVHAAEEPELLSDDRCILATEPTLTLTNHTPQKSKDDDTL